MPYFPPGGAVSFATPAFTLGTANADGAANTAVRTDDSIAVFDATVPVTQAFNDAAATGAAAVAARRDHKHGEPTTDTTWTAVTYQNAWSDFGGGFSLGAFRKDVDGYVHLRGLATHTGASAATIFQLPAGYRPGEQFDGIGSNGSGAQNFRIDTSGNVTIPGGGGTFVGFDGVVFKAEN